MSEWFFSWSVIRQAAHVARSLWSAGLRREYLYLIEETMDAVKNQDDHAVFISDLKRDLEMISVGTDIVAGSTRPAAKCLIDLHNPQAALKVFFAGLDVALHQPTWARLIEHEPTKAKVDPDTCIRQMYRISIHWVSRGQPEGLPLFFAAFLAKPPVSTEIRELLKAASALRVRRPPIVERALLHRIAELGREFASAGRFRSATGVGFLVPFLSGDRHAIQALWDDVLAPGPEHSTPFNLAGTDAMSLARSLGRMLLERGYPTYAAESCSIATSLWKSESGWAGLWGALDSRLLSKMSGMRPSAIAQVGRGFKRAVESVTARVIGSPEDVPLSLVLDDIVKDETHQSEASRGLNVRAESVTARLIRPPEDVPLSLVFDDIVRDETRQSEPSRVLNVWADHEPPAFVVDQPTTIWINIGAPREIQMTQTEIAEPDWGKRDNLSVIITVTGENISSSPPCCSAVLPKSGDMAPCRFDIIPNRQGYTKFTVSIFLVPELTLLEEAVVECDVQQSVLR